MLSLSSFRQGLLLLVLLSCLAARAAIPIQHWTMASGARVYLVESPSIAMVDLQIDFDGGARRDPAAQAGLASVTAGMASRGVLAGNGSGEPALDENRLGEAWADLGASFGAGAGGDRMSLSLRSLTEPDLLERAVALAARQIAALSGGGAVWVRERGALRAEDLQ